MTSKNLLTVSQRLVKMSILAKFCLVVLLSGVVLGRFQPKVTEGKYSILCYNSAVISTISQNFNEKKPEFKASRFTLSHSMIQY